MFSKVKVTVFLVTILMASGCTKDDSKMGVPDNIINKSLVWFDGTVLDQESETEDAQEVWKVRIRNTQGAIVAFYWFRSDETLYRVDGLSGPYDDNYDLFPVVSGLNLVNFKSVKFAATSQLKNDDLRDWRLRKEDGFDNLWIYRLNYNENNKSITAYINAISGEVLEID